MSLPRHLALATLCSIPATVILLTGHRPDLIPLMWLICFVGFVPLPRDRS